MTKTHFDTLDVTPNKRLFWSIISDYGLLTAVCELIDNSIDSWKNSKATTTLEVTIEIDSEQQHILVSDNAGGVAASDLPRLLTPGGSGNDPNASVIGIFGVGSKRACVAIGSQFSIKTRQGAPLGHQIDVDDDWLAHDSWDIETFEISDAPKQSTIVSISRLRQAVSDEQIDDLRLDLEERYAEYLNNGVQITLNKEKISPRKFDSWSFPSDFLPRRLLSKIPFDDGTYVTAEITGGLRSARDQEVDNYGVYFYCNDRLIIGALKSREVGYYVSAEAGVPHPDASLCRVIVKLKGPAKNMPWNSTKTGLNYSHKTFRSIQSYIIELVNYYTKVSRRTKQNWDDDIFAHKEEAFHDENVSPNNETKLRLPPLPSTSKHFTTSIQKLNNNLISRMPWVLGLIDSFSATHILKRQKISTKNRFALIIQDSTFEIALKEYIVHNESAFPRQQYSDSHLKKLFSRRSDVVNEILKHVKLDTDALSVLDHYYNIRNKMIHERASISVSDKDINIQGNALKIIMRTLYGAKFPQ